MAAAAALFAPAAPRLPSGIDLGGFFGVGANDTVEVWPDCWPAVELFCDLGGQWRRAGMDGVAVALDYGVLFTRMRHLGYHGDAREQMFRDVQLLEREALKQMESARDH